MRYTLLSGLVTAFLLTSASAQAQFSITISVDESCGSSFTNTGGFFTTLSCGLAADPGPGGLASALTYGLLNPPGLTAGDLILQEVGSTFNSEVIRFNPGQNGGSLVFYSDNLDFGTALADTGFPTAFYANNLTATEVGPEGGNGFVYTPTAGQPGFISGAGGPVTYVIQSDAPEPASVALFLGGAGFLLARKRLLKRRVR
jgi:hypothetical protein